MSAVRLVIFDCDGVLVDSEILSAQSVSDSLGHLGLSMTAEEVIDTLVGLDEVQTRQVLEARLGTALPGSFEADTAARLRQAYQTGLKAFPGLADVLRDLRVPFCVASNSPHERLRTTFAVTGLEPLVRGRVFSAEDVAHGKPAPDLYLHAAASMGVRVEECLVVEDSITGTTAARAAGMRVLGFVEGRHIRPGHDRQLLALGVEGVITSVAGLRAALEGRGVLAAQPVPA